ncbi:MAG: transcriptional regulator [PS1 clade bacterium]|nr:transcriptional regulator [PS1 clade bacterium]MBL6783903.1 transcriptional regulator [PS1 clade bacterium]
MAQQLTRDFREMVREDLRDNPEFRKEMLLGTLNCFLEGDEETGRSLVRNYIRADMGYKALSEKSGIHEKSLNRMFGPKGNPTLANAIKVLTTISEHEGIKLKVVAETA